MHLLACYLNKIQYYTLLNVERNGLQKDKVSLSLTEKLAEVEQCQ